MCVCCAHARRPQLRITVRLYSADENAPQKLYDYSWNTSASSLYQREYSRWRVLERRPSPNT